MMEIQCPNCKYEGIGKHITRGSVAVELVLWLLFMFPGLVYSIWRHSTRKWVCPECSFENVREIKKTNVVCMPGMFIKIIAGIIGIIFLLYVLGLIDFNK
jgi:rubredoxin